MMLNKDMAHYIIRWIEMNIKKCVIKFLNKIVSKKEKLVLFYSKPDFSDNAQAVYNYMSKAPEFHDYDLIWLCSEKKNECETSVYKKSISGLWMYLRAKIVFSSHELFPGTTVEGQIHAGLWHGMELKRIKAMLNPEHYLKDREMTFTVATSSEFQKIMSECFALPLKDVRVLGLPRNDALLHPDELALKRLNIRTSGKIVFWIPAYEGNADVSNEYEVIDEEDRNYSEIRFFDNKSIKELDNWLDNKGVYLVIKTSMLQKFSEKTAPLVKNIKFITAEECSIKHIDMYALLACGDALITDYSSIFVDYLTTDKPMGFIVDDMEKYSDNEGLTFKDPLKCLPGQIIREHDDLMNFLSDVANGVDNYKDVRAKRRRMFNIFTDDMSTQRVLEYVFDEVIVC